jgi:SAM-dependent methyltransferase
MDKPGDFKELLHKILPEQAEMLKTYLTGIRTVLDIGTGSSISIHFFSREFPDIEFSTADIADMRQEKELPFVLYDGIRLPFDDHSFDLAVLNEVLHHTKDPEPVLKEAKRVGKVIFIVEHFPKPGVTSDQLWKEEMATLKALKLECTDYKPFSRSSLFRLFDTLDLLVKDKVKLPYHGQRNIEKYFFKLVGK